MDGADRGGGGVSFADGEARTCDRNHSHQLQELSCRAAEAAEAVRRLRLENEALQAELRRALAYESIAGRLHTARPADGHGGGGAAPSPGAAADGGGGGGGRRRRPKTAEDVEALRAEVALMRSLVEQHIESEASAPAEADLSPSKSAASQEALLDGGSSFEMLLTMAEADLTEEKKALQRRARALLQAVEQGGGETSPTAGGGGAAAAACAAALPGRPPRGPPEGSSASSSSAAPALFGLGLPEGPLASAKTLASAAKGAAGRLAGALEAKQLRRLRQLDTIASRLHDELKVRRGGSSLYSPRSSSLASAPARGARAPASLGAASAAGSASASGVSSSALSGVSKARSELRGRQLDGQIKAMSRRFLLRRDMR